jgi:uncharacterized protein (DUF736 family)
MKIGILQRIGEEIRGELRTLTLRADIAFVPVCGKKAGLVPAYIILANASEVGAAWAIPGPRLSLKFRIDDPAFASPLTGTLTEAEDGEFVLLWKRPSWRG